MARTARALLPALFPILLPLLLLEASGCSTARNREAPANIVGNLQFRDASTEARFAASYRTGSLYQDFRTVLLVDAIAMDLPYRQGYVEMLRRTSLLSSADTADLLREQEADFSSSFTFLVFVFGGTNRPIPMGEPISPWKVLLQDDDGQMAAPAAVERLRPESPTYQYLTQYFYGLDRWSQAFRIAFPKLDKGALRLRLGGKPFELILTGIPGTVRLSWQDARPFYAPAAPAPQVPTAPAPAVAPPPAGDARVPAAAGGPSSLAAAGSQTVRAAAGSPAAGPTTR